MAAIAPAGELTQDEAGQLATHLNRCAECADLLMESNLASTVVPLLDAAKVAEDAEPLSGAEMLAQRNGRKQVIWRLREAGVIRDEARARPIPIPVSPASTRSRLLWPITAAAIACGLIVAINLGVSNMHRAQERGDHAEAQTAAIRADLEKAARRIADLESARAALLGRLDNKSRDAFLVAQRGAETTSAMAELTSAHEADAAKLGELKEQLKGLLADLESARNEGRSLSAQKSELETRSQANAKSSSFQLAEEQKRVAQLEGRIQELARRSQEQRATLEKQERLLATDRDIRDLLGSRNLLIMELADNTAGRQEPWFGRIFYTEGKSLVLYAFDLDQQKNRKGVSAFQVWGDKQGVKPKPRSLGVLSVDPKTQDRWVFRCEDPQVLAQIDRVWITVEPPGGSAIPHGKELLAINLTITPNHP